MNIDLLLTKRGEAGLVGDMGFKSPVAGVMFDVSDSCLTLEFSNMDAMELNVPVEEMFAELLWGQSVIQIGTITNGMVTDNRQVPLMLINDPYHGQGRHPPEKPTVSVLAFEAFLKSCTDGQPAHRDDLGNELSSSGVLAGVNPAVLKFAPNLVRQRAMEISPKAAPAAAPRMAGPSGPGGMGEGGGGGGITPSRQMRPPPPRMERDEDDD